MITLIILGFFERFLEGTKLTGLSISITLLSLILAYVVKKRKGNIKDVGLNIENNCWINYATKVVRQSTIPIPMFGLMQVAMAVMLFFVISLGWYLAEMTFYGASNDCWGDVLIVFAASNSLTDMIMDLLFIHNSKLVDEN